MSSVFHHFFDRKISLDSNEIISWLLEGDVSIQYQVHRDLLNKDRPDLQKRIANKGWGKQFLECQNSDGHWGRKFYQPKWISTHYTLLDIKNLNISPTNKTCKKVVNKLLDEEKGIDGGINPHTEINYSDVCVNGMFINYACYFGAEEEKLKSVIDCLLEQHMHDGGFNCQSTRSGAKHSSLHSTISVLEGILEYKLNGYRYRLNKLLEVEEAAQEFILRHKLFLSDRTGKVINKKFLTLPFPHRWYYNILRALDYFQVAQGPYDQRMKPAIDVLLSKRNKDGTWNVQAKHSGAVHFEMEKAGRPSRWNTLRAMRVLKHFNLLQSIEDAKFQVKL